MISLFKALKFNYLLTYYNYEMEKYCPYVPKYVQFLVLFLIGSIKELINYLDFFIFNLLKFAKTCIKGLMNSIFIESKEK